ncbi:MAG: hypothetical protein K6G83_05605 [Lachnospiraceae bacterium]|nr:hypothetical protein [Lachnospiraceae bacterium]
MQDKPTDELNALLENMTPDQLDSYFKENKSYMADEKAFYYYVRAVLDKKNIKLKDVYSFAGVTESYGGQILRMEKHTKNRDMIIRLCIAGHFSTDEINRALKFYDMKSLYAKEPRDACIIVALNNRIFDLGEIDDILEKQGLKKLSIDE